MRASYLTVNSVNLDGPAWHITNLETEISRRDTYGENLRIDGAAGKRALTHFRDEVIMQFKLVVRGKFDKDGGTNSNLAHGFKVNADYLISNLSLGSPVTATYHDANGSTTKTATVIVRSLTFDDIGTQRDAMCILELAVPSGQFA